MIEFLTEKVREDFHLLPPETQKEWIDLAYSKIGQGEIITVLTIDRWSPDPKDLEVTVRIDRKFDPSAPVRN